MISETTCIYNYQADSKNNAYDVFHIFIIRIVFRLFNFTCRALGSYNYVWLIDDLNSLLEVDWFLISSYISLCNLEVWIVSSLFILACNISPFHFIRKGYLKLILWCKKAASFYIVKCIFISSSKYFYCKKFALCWTPKALWWFMKVLLRLLLILF